MILNRTNRTQSALLCSPLAVDAPLIWDSRKCEGTISKNALFRHLPHRYTHSGTFTRDKSPALCAFALFWVCHLWIHTQNFRRPPHRNFLSSAWEFLKTTGTFKTVDYFGERWQLKSKLRRKKRFTRMVLPVKDLIIRGFRGDLSKYHWKKV